MAKRPFHCVAWPFWIIIAIVMVAIGSALFVFWLDVQNEIKSMAQMIASITIAFFTSAIIPIALYSYSRSKCRIGAPRPSGMRNIFIISGVLIGVIIVTVIGLSLIMFGVI